MAGLSVMNPNLAIDHSAASVLYVILKYHDELMLSRERLSNNREQFEAMMMHELSSSDTFFSPVPDHYIVCAKAASEEYALYLARLFRNAFQQIDVSVRWRIETRGSISIGVILADDSELEGRLEEQRQEQRIAWAKSLALKVHQNPGNEIELIDLRRHLQS